MTRSTLALLAAVASLLPVSLSHAQNATTAPVGAVTYLFPANSYTTMGISLLRPPVLSTKILGGNSTSISIDGSSNFGALLTSNSSYFVEVTGHTDGQTATHVGDRFEVDVAASISGADSSIRINTQSPLNTATGDFSGLAGYNIVVRPHWTLASLFGTGSSATQLQSSTTLPSADQVHFWTGTGMNVYWFRQNSAGTIREWRSVETGVANKDTEIVPPGVGIFFKRSAASDLELVLSGEVRSNKYVQLVPNGTRLVASGFPMEMSPTQVSLLPSSGFQSATTPVYADQIWTWTGVGVSTYWLRQNSTGTIKEWRNTSTGTTAFTETKFLPAQGAFFIKTASDVASVEVAKPY